MKLILIRALSILLVGVGLLFGLPTQVQSAVVSVSMELGGVGSTSWALNNLAPGSSGNQLVSLRNSGRLPGKVDIWISNIRWTSGRDGQADLDEYLRLNINGSGLVSTITMPAKVSDLPASSAAANQLYIQRLDPGQTLTINWNWQFIETGSPQNNAQGDGLVFDINYGLTQITDVVIPTGVPVITTSVPTSPAAEDRVIQLEVPANSTQSGITAEGVTKGILEASTPDNGFMLSILPGTRITLSNENRPDPVDLDKVGDTIPNKIEVSIINDPALIPPYPDGWIPVSPNYDINGITNDIRTGIKLDQSAIMVIRYAVSQLPTILDGLYIFYYSYGADSWVQLSEPEGFIAAADEKAGEVDHFSLFVVLAKPGAGIQPADIVMQKISVNPQRIMVGQSSEVKVRLTNKGGMPGEEMVTIKMNGQVQKTQRVYLEAGQSTEVVVMLAPGQNGIYTITSGKLSGELVVEPNVAPDISETDYWWLLCIAMGLAVLILSFVHRRKITAEEE